MLTVRAIASGSSGNAFAVGTERVSLLLDAGLSARRLMRSLEAAWFAPERIAGVVLTHEHHDHSSGAVALSRELGVPIYATDGTARALRLDPGEVVPLRAERSLQLDDLELTPFPVVHDAAEPVGLMVRHEDRRIALVTDIGSVDECTQRWADEADLLILDSNHDLLKLWGGPYPAALKRRIASPRGHLSNEQAARCIATAAERGRTRWAWLAHLSDTNNTQRAALATVNARLTGAEVSIEVTRRAQPSLVWRSTMAYVQGRLL
jgi:phosphoribosyl 1,2-cyclic phosphodiesterase